MTTAQAAEFYGTTEHNITKNFNDEKARFIEGKHFFKLKGEDLKNLQVTICDSQTFHISPKTRALTLWTKSGLLRHCKMLNTDKAWEVFEMMENTFFNFLENEKYSSHINNYFPPELSERWADIKSAEVLVKIAKLTDSTKFRKSLIKRSANFIDNKNFDMNTDFDDETYADEN